MYLVWKPRYSHLNLGPMGTKVGPKKGIYQGEFCYPVLIQQYKSSWKPSRRSRFSQEFSLSVWYCSNLQIQERKSKTTGFNDSVIHNSWLFEESWYADVYGVSIYNIMYHDCILYCRLVWNSLLILNVDLIQSVDLESVVYLMSTVDLESDLNLGEIFLKVV